MFLWANADCSEKRIKERKRKQNKKSPPNPPLKDKYRLIYYSHLMFILQPIINTSFQCLHRKTSLSNVNSLYRVCVCVWSHFHFDKLCCVFVYIHNTTPRNTTYRKKQNFSSKQFLLIHVYQFWDFTKISVIYSNIWRMAFFLRDIIILKIFIFLNWEITFTYSMFNFFSFFFIIFSLTFDIHSHLNEFELSQSFSKNLSFFYDEHFRILNLFFIESFFSAFWRKFSTIFFYLIYSNVYNMSRSKIDPDVWLKCEYVYHETNRCENMPRIVWLDWIETHTQT